MFKSSDAYGKVLNSYDALKLLALAAMILDHAGAYLWPECDWLRVVGRAAFPLFLFLVGFSGKWKKDNALLLCAAAITLCAALTHHAIFPLTILFTIIAVRALMPWILRKSLDTPYLSAIFIVSLIWWLPTLCIVDYGTLAVVFACCGVLARERPGAAKTYGFLGAALVAYFLTQLPMFMHSAGLFLCMLAVMGALAYCMYGFCIRPVITDAWARPLRWCARNTLALYTLHVLLFMILEKVYFPERLLQFRWI